MLGYRSPTVVSKPLSSGTWRQVLTTCAQDPNSSVGQVPDCRGSRRDRGEELMDGAGSRLMCEGKPEVLLREGMRDAVRASRKRCALKNMETGGSGDSSLAGVLPRVTEQALWVPPQHAVLSPVPQVFWCTGNTQVKASPACSLLVTHALLPIVTWVTFRDTSSCGLSMYLIPPKMGVSSDTLFCISVVKLGL